MKINEILTEAVKQRLDAKCWTGKHKEGTKIKGGVRVNNCVPNESINEAKQLSVEQLATISDEALDAAYHYGRSQPGNTFGWQANLKSATYAKQIIDKGVTDVEAISDAIHRGWNVTAQAFVKNPMQFDDSKTMAPEKLQAKIAQRQKLMTQNYAQLPEDEKEKDRVVARAMLQAITGGEQGVAEGEGSYPEILYHGSTQEIKGPLTPRQAHDIGGAPGSNKNAIYATDDPNFAIAYSLAERGSDTGTLGWKQDPHLIFFGGKIRHGQNVYLYTLPTRDQQGNPLFTPGGADAEWHSVPGVTAVTPIKVKELPVDRYLGLLRKPTPDEQKVFQANQARDKAKRGMAEDAELAEEFDLIESIIEDLAASNGVDSEVIWEDLESLDDDELYVFAVTQETITEDWQKVNKKDKTDGMSKKAVKAYRREHPGSKLKTAVTTKPSKLKKGSKASKRRKSYCSRSKGQMKMHNISCAKTPDKAICKARRRWNC